ncbi:MAG: UDP-N-acetylmuramate dehydrogenase [Ruminococcaceae bacterium]|nr:UDP-N-acetylmuramate dehydrogenase [Oscillospiraceae bacterium]
MNDIKALRDRLQEILPAFSIREEEPLAKHTSFRIGGNAQLMVFPRTSQELSAVLQAAKEFNIVVKILGAGTNVLAPDEGVSGLVICLRETFMGLRLLDGNIVEAMAGMSLAQTAMFAARNGLSGMECLHGIPGTVGGGVYMNAGAYGGEIKDIALRTEFMSLDGKTQWFEGQAQELGYRKSVFQGLQGVIVRTQFQLQKGEESEIRAKIRELNEKRRASQPLEMPSAGSTFKRPTGYFAGTLIDEAGLKGLSVGGAQVSEKHAGFIVNKGGATAKDVLALIELVQQRVYENSGVHLEPEVRLWGRE